MSRRKLYPGAIEEILELMKSGVANIDLAKKYKVSPGLISRIRVTRLNHPRRKCLQNVLQFPKKEKHIEHRTAPDFELEKAAAVILSAVRRGHKIVHFTDAEWAVVKNIPTFLTDYVRFRKSLWP